MPSLFDVVFRRPGGGPHALALAMAAVRMAERVLLVGDDGALFAELASKAGLTGHACAVAGSEAVAARIRGAAAEAGVLLDVEIGALPSLPVASGEFDVAVVDAGHTLLQQLDDGGRTTLARSVARALRHGGRALVVERQATRLFGLVRSQPRGLAAFHASGGAIAMLQAAGFRPVRLLAERDGQRFTEGLRPGR